MKKEQTIEVNYDGENNILPFELRKDVAEILDNRIPAWVEKVTIYGHAPYSETPNAIGVRLHLPIKELEEGKALHSLSTVNEKEGRVIALRLIDNVLCIDCEWEL